MVRNYQRKSQAGLIPHQQMKQAAEAVLGGEPVRKVAEDLTPSQHCTAMSRQGSSCQHPNPVPACQQQKPNLSTEQSLGRSKASFNSGFNSFMPQNPGKNLTIYNMVSLINEAWLRASTPQNVKS